MEALRVLDSATQLDASARGAVVVCGSHGGTYPAWLAARAGVGAAVFNDAGIGLQQAGVAGLAGLAELGIAACAVDHGSARIGDGADTLASGIVTVVNEVAARLGCEAGQSCREAAQRLATNAAGRAAAPIPGTGETRTRLENTGHRAVWALDSVALSRPQDRRAILVTGSHGALLGGRPDHMLEVDVFAAIFNDAGGGKDGAGYSRLAELNGRAIAAAAVACETARIGDGRSTYETGVVSHANTAARRLGLTEGLTTREAVARLVGLA